LAALGKAAGQIRGVLYKKKRRLGSLFFFYVEERGSFHGKAQIVIN
jgi:hypothetical protein